MSSAAIARAPRRGVDHRVNDDPELHLLIECCRTSIELARAARIRERTAAGLNWDRLLLLAQRHGLTPLLFWQLNRTCRASVPAGPLEFLHDYFRKNSALNLLLTGELVRLLNLLNDNGISAIPFKGPALAVQLYGHVALRQFCDLDILVRERDVAAASRLIEQRGFEPDLHLPDCHRVAFMRQDYVRLFRRDAGRTLLELHWGIAPHFFAVRFAVDAVWARLGQISLLRTTVATPGPEDLLLMLCVHGARHLWGKMEGVCAIAELMRQRATLDWDYVWSKSREMHCRRMLVLGMLLAHDVFDVDLPPRAPALSRSRTLLAMAGNIVRGWSADDVPVPTTAREIALQLRLRDSYSDRVRYCGRLILTPTPADWAHTRLAGSWAVAYPLLRAIRLVRKHCFDNQPAAATLSTAERPHGVAIARDAGRSGAWQ